MSIAISIYVHKLCLLFNDVIYGSNFTHKLVLLIIKIFESKDDVTILSNNAIFRFKSVFDKVVLTILKGFGSSFYSIILKIKFSEKKIAGKLNSNSE